MNYQKHYNTLMERSPKTKIKGVYLERHRILPGCMGGKYVIGNIAYLTPEEHFVAHQLLVKMYPGNSKLIYAANTLGNTNNKQYGWLKRQFSEHISKQFKGKRFSPKTEFKKGMKPTETSWKKGHTTWNKGKTGIFSAETLQIMSEQRKGNQYALGAVRSEETRKKLSIARTGKGMGQSNAMASAENRAKVSASKIGRKKQLQSDGKYKMVYPQ